MRIKSEFSLKQIGESPVIHKNGVSLNVAISSIGNTDTSFYLWEILKEKDLTKTEMLELLIKKFDISTVLALGNIDVFVRTLRENDIIEE